MTSKSILEAKSRMYDKLKKGETPKLAREKFLVDFDQQKVEELEKTENFENQRKEFYENLRFENEVLKARGVSGSHLELSRRQIEQEKEREAWEAEALQNMETEFDELNSLKKRYFIKQSYDKKMTSGDKEELQNVLQEEKESKDMLSKIRALREKSNQQRLEKLKKLKLTNNN